MKTEFEVHSMTDKKNEHETPGEDEALLQLLRRLSRETDFDAPGLLHFCIQLRDAARQEADEKSQASARLAGKIADLLKRYFTESNGSPGSRTAAPKKCSNGH